MVSECIFNDLEIRPWNFFIPVIFKFYFRFSIVSFWFCSDYIFLFSLNCGRESFHFNHCVLFLSQFINNEKIINLYKAFWNLAMEHKICILALKQLLDVYYVAFHKATSYAVANPVLLKSFWYLQHVRAIIWYSTRNYTYYI